MQLMAQMAVDAAKTQLKVVSARTAQAAAADPDRDFLMLVVMDLKPTLDRSDLLNPVDLSRGGGPISPEVVRRAFVHFAKQLRPEFEKTTGLRLVLSGEFPQSGTYRFVNLWKIHSPNDVPKMMEALAMPKDKSQLYGHLDYMVAKEVQDVFRVFPFGTANVQPPAAGKRLYYVLLPHNPPTLELYGFRVRFTSYPEPLPTAGKFKLITSMISVTGTLNRIYQFWSLEVDAGNKEDPRELVRKAFGKLPWRNPDDERYNAEEAILLCPTEWDDSVVQKASIAPNSAAPGANRAAE